jgi:hypothetical protein
MQVQTVPAVPAVPAVPLPVVAGRSRFGTVPVLFMSVDEDVAACTLPTDDEGSTYAVDGAASVWVAVPLARDVLVAAWMLSGPGGVDAAGVEVMSEDEVRAWALEGLAYCGCGPAKAELAGAGFGSSYREHRYAAELAPYFDLVSARIDTAFGFAGTPGRP